MMLSVLCCVRAVHVSVWLPGGCVDTGYVSALAAGLRNLLSACRPLLRLKKFHPKVRNHGEGPY